MMQKSNEKNKLIFIQPKQSLQSISTSIVVLPYHSSGSTKLPFKVLEFHSIVRLARIHPPKEVEENNDYCKNLPFCMVIMGISNVDELLSLTFHQIIECVISDARDLHVLEMNVHLQDFTREVVRVFACTSVLSSSLGLCKPLVIDNQWLIFGYGWSSH